MDFRLSLFFLFLYFIRPQDWVQAFIGANVVKPLMVAWIVALMSRRESSPMAGLLTTPHDWLIMIYFSYVVWNAPESQATFSAFLPLIVFYVLTVQSLTEWDRVLGYLRFWNWMLLGIAAIAVASRYGMDLTGAVDMTEQNFGRLAIGTWLCDNPNALAHTVVLAIPLSYYLFFWKKSLAGFVGFALSSILAGACIFYTESKGAFLVGGGLVVLIYVIGRPLLVKIFVIATAAILGVSALSFLPRMEKMGDLRSDEGVQGRLMAWEMARNVTQTTNTGVGWRQFIAMITWQGETLKKATHSSYVQIGADLGVYGIFLFVGGLWASGHSLLVAQRLTREHPDRERCRRMALIMLLAYAFSSWMINREYHTEYFLLIAIAASIHRLCKAEDAEIRESLTDEASLSMVLETRVKEDSGLPVLTVSAAEDDALNKRPLWNSFGLADLAACAGLTWAVLAIWDYVLSEL